MLVDNRAQTAAHSSLRDKLEELSASIEQRPVLLFFGMTVFYLVIILFNIRKGLWFDELFTYYIAQQGTIARLFAANKHTDLSPPLLALLVRFSQWLLGPSEAATRLPTAIGFWVGSAAIYFVLAKRTGYLVSACMIATLWSGFFLLYATEARPYGILLGFFGLALFCWDILPTTRYSVWATIGLGLSVVGMMLSHVLAPFSILPICAGQLVRSIRSRSVSWPVWLVLLLPMSLEFTYLHWMRQFERFIFPSIYQASLARMVRFFGRLAYNAMLPVGLATLAGLLVTQWKKPLKWNFRFSWSDVAVGGSLFIVPFAIVAALSRTQGAFHFRYAIVAALVYWVAYSVLVNYIFRNSRLAAVVFVVTALSTTAIDSAVHYRADAVSPGPHQVLRDIKPELPFVAGSGLTFLELDHYESPKLTSRLYYLTDREYATKYAHATLWEGYRNLFEFYPIRGKIENYRDFIRKNPDFLVFGTPEYLEDWLLRRIADDPNMSIKVVGKLSCCYRDQEIFEVKSNAQLTSK